MQLTDAVVPPKGERLQTLDALRGVAAFAVLWNHFSRIPEVLASSRLNASGRYGWIGVGVFFVISGFVIPFALHKAQYQLRDLSRFLVKRLVRLEPPYIASIIIALLLRFLLHAGRPGRRMPSMANLLLHPLYLNGVFRSHWILPVYWTLAVEVQFYLLIGVAFPLIRRPTLFWTIVAPASIALAFALPYPGQIFRNLPFFLLGIATFQFSSSAIGRLPFLGISLVLTAIGVRLLDPYAVLAGLGAALVIAFIRRIPKVLVGLGAISYPLYLLHLPVGYVALVFARRYSVSSPWLLVAVATIASLFGAWLLHLAVEIPAQRWSSRIRYADKGSGARNYSSDVPVFSTSRADAPTRQ